MNLMTLLRIGLARALNRFEDRIRDISVLITDVNGPKGGADKLLRIRVLVSGCESVVLTAFGSNLSLMIDDGRWSHEGGRIFSNCKIQAFQCQAEDLQGRNQMTTATSEAAGPVLERDAFDPKAITGLSSSGRCSTTTP